MLNIRCEEHMEAVKNFAKENGIEDKLQFILEYLDNFGGKEATEVRLFKDFAPYSFYWEAFKNGKVWMNGGCIYFDSDKEWSVHT